MTAPGAVPAIVLLAVACRGTAQADEGPPLAAQVEAAVAKAPAIEAAGFEAEPAREASTLFPAIWYGAALAADGITTERFINLRDEKGTLWLHERNLITKNMPGRAGRIGYYSATALGYWLLDRKLQPKHPRLAWALRVLALQHVRAAVTNVRAVDHVKQTMKGPWRPMEGLDYLVHRPGQARPCVSGQAVCR